MIIKASQRGGAKALAQHLLRTDENEHVEIHEIRGFASGNITSALKEAQAVSSATRCKQFLFSVSLSPPPNERVLIETFEAAIDQVEDRNCLKGQPRVIVFHEKEGRRHAHVVWSRIDAETMTARNLPHFKLKLRDLSRELYLENLWLMPRGLMKTEARDPRNFTLAEWQQAKRLGFHAHDIKELMRECWAVSDAAASFESALSERGFTLARGDRRGFVAVRCDGEVIPVTRAAGLKVKQVRERLGPEESWPSVGEAKAKIAAEMRTALNRYLREITTHQKVRSSDLERRRSEMAATHRREREALQKGQRHRAEYQARQRLLRLKTGLAGLWQRVTGQRRRTIDQLQQEAYDDALRDRSQRQDLIDTQLAEREALQREIEAARREYVETVLKLRSDRNQAALRMRHKPSNLDREKKMLERSPRTRRANSDRRRQSKGKSIVREQSKGPQIK